MGKGLTRELIAARVARELRDGMYVNLGLGLPTLVPLFIPSEREVVVQSENGVLGCGPVADAGEQDVDLINASGQPITLRPGGCYFHHADSFGMIRGGHLDVAVLGAFQVSEKGDLANWKTPSDVFGTIGGAMDIATSVKRLLIAMEHVDGAGRPKIVRECSYPLTAKAVVNTIFTNLAVIEVTASGLVLSEVAPGVSIDEVRSATEPPLIISDQIREIEL